MQKMRESPSSEQWAVHEEPKPNHGYQNEKKTTLAWCLKRRARLEQQPDRTIFLNRPDEEIPNNSIETSKYNWASFLPENLLLQFSRSANLYFLILGICQMIPLITTTDGKPIVYTPLSVIILISMGKDFWEDLQRHRADREENSKPARVFCNATDQVGRLVQQLQQQENENSESASSNCPSPPKSLFFKRRWAELRVGHVIKVQQDESFPADVLLLQSAHQGSGLVYVETKNLDGETNLKAQQVPRVCTQFFTADEDFASEAVAPENLQVSYEKPTPYMYQFSGFLSSARTSQKHFVDQAHFVKRGCVLRNTPWCVGLVLYTGHDTKVMLNQVRGKYKKSRIERQMNTQILLVFLFLLALCVLSAVLYVAIYSLKQDQLSYLQISQEAGDLEANPFIDFCAHVPMWFLLLASFVPISLLVTLEFVKFFQGVNLSRDQNMISRETGESARANSSNLNEELGLVNYVVSDKTGTLTANLMQFRCLSVGPHQYGYQAFLASRQGDAQWEGESPKGNGQQQQENVSVEASTTQQLPRKKAKKVTDFKDDEFFKQFQELEHANNQSIIDCLNCINLCHTITVESGQKKQQDGNEQEVTYNAQSPDEFALIKFTEEIGYQFVGQENESSTLTILRHYSAPRPNQQLHEQNPQQQKKRTIKFKLLQTLGFTYERKRMSVIVQNELGQIILYCKGADSALAALASKDTDVNPEFLMEKLMNKDLKTYAEFGLRTLVLGKKRLSKEQYDKWSTLYDQALSSLLQDRSRNIEALQTQIEQDLQIIGATAIEDKLQESVPATVQALRDAGIKVWMLTGDKIETAINIGYSCNILSQQHSRIFTFNEMAITRDAIETELVALEAWLEGQKEEAAAKKQQQQLQTNSNAEAYQQDPVENGSEFLAVTSPGIKHRLHGTNKTYNSSSVDMSSGNFPDQQQQHNSKQSTKSNNNPFIQPDRIQQQQQSNQLNPNFSHNNPNPNPNPYHANPNQANPNPSHANANPNPNPNQANPNPNHANPNPNNANPNQANPNLANPNGSQKKDPAAEAAIVIFGLAFKSVYEDELLMGRFMRAALQCGSVIGARVTPREKQLFVQYIKEFDAGATTLAIGDGANDVAMISEAHVGVGIKGVEGREAAKASDYELGEFRFLQRLLFYTGTECCRRNSMLILYNFYKNQSLHLAQFWFGVYSDFSAQFIFDQWISQLFNLIFTSLPIILYALYDEQFSSGQMLQDQLTRPNQLEQRPDLYRQGALKPVFTTKTFWIWLANGALQSVVFLFLAFNIFSNNFNNEDGRMNEIYHCGMLVFSAAVILNNFKILLLTFTHYGFTLFFVAGSVASYFIVLWIASQFTALESYDYYNRIFGNANASLALIIMTVCTCGLDLAVQRYSHFLRSNEEEDSALLYKQQIDSVTERTQNIEMPELHKNNNNNKNIDLNNISANVNTKLNSEQF